MRVFIDGYNLIRRVPELSWLDQEDLSRGRDELLLRLSRYRAARRLDLTVVFDGAGRTGVTRSPPSFPGLSVLFSPPGQTADDVLARLCQAGEGDLLVTSDAHLAARAGKVTVLGSDGFWEKVEAERMRELKGEEPERRQERGIPGRRRSKQESRRKRLEGKL